MELPPKHIIDLLRSVTLSEEERSSMRSTLLAHIHTTTTRQAIPSPWAHFFLTKRFQASVLSMIIILTYGTSATFAAEGSLPGDVLYPIKTKVIEPVKRLVIARSPEAEATFETKLLEKRLEEAEALDTKKDLNPELATIVREGIHKQNSRAKEKIIDIEKKSGESVSQDMQPAIEASMSIPSNVLQKEQRAKSRLDGKNDHKRALNGVREQHKHILEKLDLTDDEMDTEDE